MSGHKMALLAEESDCYQLVNCMYRCKRLKALRSRHLKEYHHHHHHHMLRYRFEQEILILERVQESQEKHRLFKYNNKRCNCKIKNVDSHIHSEHFAIDTTDRHPSNASNSWTSRDINCSSEICASMIAGVWHRPSMVQHTPSKSDGPTVAVGCSKIWSPLRQSQMGAPLPPLSPPSAPSPPVHQASSEAEANSATYATSYLPIVYDSFDCIETISTYCDIASDYMKNSVSSKINLITYKKKQSQSQSQSETQSHQQQQQQQQREREQEQEQERHRNVKHRPSGYYYLWMMFIMVVKEFIQYVSRSLRRMRRKTQYLLPIIILLQLLLAVPLTNCTSPPNETSSAVLSSAAAAFVPSMSFGAGIMNTSSQESPASGTPSISEKQPSPADSANSQSSHQYHAPVGGTSSSGDEFPYRSSGGGSITSYINHRINMRREPSSSYSNSGCHSCQMREQVKADNLESIKRHILLRLEMRILPNITAPPVPHTIIESFYKNQSFLANKAASSGGDVRKNAHSDDNDMDDPSLGSMSHSNDYINGYSRDQHHNDMQGDDPNAYSGDYNHGGEEDDEKKGQGLYRDDSDSDEFFSVVNRVYVFPTMPRMRHNRKAEILNFQFKGSDHSTVSQALLHVYLRGRDWIREYEPNLLNSKSNPEHNRREIVITISRVVRRVNSTVATHTVNVTESPHKIPNGLGEWISIDVTQLVQSWLRDTTTNQGIVIKGSEPWMKPFITTGDSPNNKAFTVYIEILTKDNRKRRSKRNTSMNCSESDNEQRCCRYPLVVNFTEFEWNWVVAPTSFDAYFCNGECRVGFMERYPHTHLVQLSTAPQPCCSPTKMSPLQLLYFNTDNILVMSTIPNMAVDQCSCS